LYKIFVKKLTFGEIWKYCGINKVEESTEPRWYHSRKYFLSGGHQIICGGHQIAMWWPPHHYLVTTRLSGCHQIKIFSAVVPAGLRKNQFAIVRKNLSIDILGPVIPSFDIC